MVEVLQVEASLRKIGTYELCGYDIDEALLKEWYGFKCERHSAFRTGIPTVTRNGGVVLTNNQVVRPFSESIRQVSQAKAKSITSSSYLPRYFPGTCMDALQRAIASASAAEDPLLCLP